MESFPGTSSASTHGVSISADPGSPAWSAYGQIQDAKMNHPWVVLWVLWIYGEMESHAAAEKAGISKGTLTRVVRTLQSRGLLLYNPHPPTAVACCSASPPRASR